MPNLVHVKRDYSQIFEKYIALGPNIENKMGAHGLAWDVSDEYQTLYAQMVRLIIQTSFLMAVQAFTNVRKLVMLY